MAELKALSIRHETIMDYLMANPSIPLGAVAAQFGVTQPWLSQIIHSDVFQARLSEKKDIAFHHTVLPVREKLTNIAHQALDKLAERLPHEDEVRNLQAVASDVLDRLGFGAPKVNGTQVNVQQNIHVTALREEIDQARALIGARAPRPALEVATNGSRTVLALPAESPARLVSSVQASAFSFLETERGESSPRDSVREESSFEDGEPL